MVMDIYSFLISGATLVAMVSALVALIAVMWSTLLAPLFVRLGVIKRKKSGYMLVNHIHSGSIAKHSLANHPGKRKRRDIALFYSRYIQDYPKDGMLYNIGNSKTSDKEA